jgi:hypothetical protein
MIMQKIKIIFLLIGINLLLSSVFVVNISASNYTHRLTAFDKAQQYAFSCSQLQYFFEDTDSNDFAKYFGYFEVKCSGQTKRTFGFEIPNTAYAIGANTKSGHINQYEWTISGKTIEFHTGFTLVRWHVSPNSGIIAWISPAKGYSDCLAYFDSNGMMSTVLC